jgi:hypothetical protein
MWHYSNHSSNLFLFWHFNLQRVAKVQSEFKKQIEQITDNKKSDKILSIVKVAGEEFPCLACASKDECGSFKWFTKWFGTDFATAEE